MTTNDVRTSQFDNNNVKNPTTRSGFDLSETLQFTSKIGQLLPIYHRTCMPLDKFRIKASMITQSLSFKSIPFTQIRQHIDWFFVPYDQIYKNSRNVLTNNVQNTDTAANSYTDLTTSEKMPSISTDFLFNSFQGGLPYIYQQMNDYSKKAGFGFVAEDEVGFNRFFTSRHLLNALGYGYKTDSETEASLEDPSSFYKGSYNLPARVSALPLFAYHKIYNDFYRRSRWENTVAYNFNCDYANDGIISFPSWSPTPSSAGWNYWTGPNLFDMHYASYPKDLVFGVLPDSQYGSPATITSSTENGAILQLNTSSSLPSADVLAGPDPVYMLGSVKSLDLTGSVGENTVAGLSYTDALKDSDMPVGQGIGLTTSAGRVNINADIPIPSLNSELNYLSIRNAQFVQKYREILGSGDLDYSTIMYKIFGVKLSPEESHKVKYLGGSVSFMQFDQVVNQNITSSETEAVRVSNGYSKDDGEYIEFDVKDHGILMCIYHAEPMISFATNGVHFDITKTEVDDFANPVFDRLGYEELPSEYFFNIDEKDGPLGNTNLGFTSRYFDYKTGFDRVIGDFRESRKNYVTPITTSQFSYYYNNNSSGSKMVLDPQFFKIRPSQLDPITYVKADAKYNTDQFSNSVGFDIKSVRNLDSRGLPY